jgi:hypothetical protein
MFSDKGFEHLIHFPYHKLVKLVECEIDAVIGHAPLRKVIGADALRAIPSSHF